eukprot:s230_g8.t1
MIAKRLFSASQSSRVQVDAGEASQDQSADVPSKSKVQMGQCDICGEAMEAIRLIKTLPCNHHFHFDCIDRFHRQKLLEKNLDLPCSTCGVASNKSIAAVMEERRKKKEEEEAVELARQAQQRAREHREQRESTRPNGSLAALAAASRETGALSQFDAMDGADERESKRVRQESSESKQNPVDGVTDFKKGQRDFTPKSDTGTAICADFSSKEKEYTNGVIAPNRWRSHQGQLTGELVRIPDVDSGYPKSVYPTKWEDGQALPKSVESFAIGDGFPDQNEFKMKFGVIIPSTNTTVEYDFWNMVMSNRDECKAGFQKGIGFHTSGILIDSPKLATDEDMLNFLAMFRKQLFTTVDRLMTAEPQYIIMGMSLETFFGGWEGNKELKGELSQRTGLNIATGAEACKASLNKFGAKRITVLTPYQEIGDRNVVKFFSEIGFEVVRIAGLKCGSATDIAHVPEAWCEKVIRENLCVPVDAIVQCGTNLSMVALADRLEQELDIPIIAINVACLWFAMREASDSEMTERLLQNGGTSLRETGCGQFEMADIDSGALAHYDFGCDVTCLLQTISVVELLESLPAGSLCTVIP